MRRELAWLVLILVGCAIGPGHSLWCNLSRKVATAELTQLLGPPNMGRTGWQFSEKGSTWGVEVSGACFTGKSDYMLYLRRDGDNRYDRDNLDGVHLKENFKEEMERHEERREEAKAFMKSRAARSK